LNLTSSCGTGWPNIYESVGTRCWKRSARNIGLTHFVLGDYVEALPYVQRAYRAVTPIEQQAQIGISAMDYSIVARCVEAHILWHRGLLDQNSNSGWRSSRQLSAVPHLTQVSFP